MIKLILHGLLLACLPFIVLAQDINPKMVAVHGGTFEMGSNDGADNEKPVHSAKLSDFSIGKYEVTQEEWKTVMGNNPSIHKNCDDCPVDNVSFDDVKIFLEKLNKITGKKFRLPTEAEWAYAARGGEKSKKYKYSGSDDINKVGWVISNSGGETKPVGSKKPNELGLYDMSGNVWEWVNDLYSADYYLNSPSENPTGATRGNTRIVRGGSAFYTPLHSRPSTRMIISPKNPHHNYGFRLAL